MFWSVHPRLIKSLEDILDLFAAQVDIAAVCTQCNIIVIAYVDMSCLRAAAMGDQVAAVILPDIPRNCIRLQQNF